MTPRTTTATGSRATPTPVKYPPHTMFWRELRRRVDEYFATTGKTSHGGARIWLKTAILLGWAASSYAILVFVASTWWQVALLGASLGLAVAGIGFNVQHDGGHESYASHRRINRLAASVLDVIGGSSYMWRYKHNHFHHHYTNVVDVDDDLDASPFLRLSTGHRRLPFHRLQHLYIWPLYVFFPPKWQWYDDFSNLITGRIGPRRIPRPKGWSLAWLFIGKALFAAWALAVPLVLHPTGAVLVTYAFICLVTGVTLGTVFQLAHCVEEANVEGCPEPGERMTAPWAEHQLATTVDFAPRNRLLTWYLGGLNYQVEHHLFPRISHVHYPAIAQLVRRTCDEHGVPYLSHRSVVGALRSHLRHLRRLGTRSASVSTS